MWGASRMTQPTPEKEPSPYLRQRDAHNLLQVSRSTFQTLRKRPGFPQPRYPGSQPVWSRAELIAWVDAQTAPVAA